MTKTVRFEGSQLTVNAAVSRGALRVELQDEGGGVLPGFASADCRPATGDGVALAVRWHNDSDLRKLAGRPVRLQFELRDGSLYAFRFA